MTIPKADKMIEIVEEQYELVGQLNFGDYSFQVVKPSVPNSVEGLPEFDPEHPENCPDIVVHKPVAEGMQKLGVEFPGAIYTLETGPQSMVRGENGRPIGVQSISLFQERKV